MCQPDRDLSQAAPQFPFLRDSRLPGALQHLMGMEGAASVEQTLRLLQRLLRRQHHLGHARCARRVTRQRPTQLVARPGAPWSSRRVPIPRPRRVAHRFLNPA